jgi:hypothetical protein
MRTYPPPRRASRRSYGLLGHSQCVLPRKREPNATTPWDKYSPGRMLYCLVISSRTVYKLTPFGSILRNFGSQISNLHVKVPTDAAWVHLLLVLVMVLRETRKANRISPYAHHLLLRAELVEPRWQGGLLPLS